MLMKYSSLTNGDPSAVSEIHLLKKQPYYFYFHAQPLQNNETFTFTANEVFSTLKLQQTIVIKSK